VKEKLVRALEAEKYTTKTYARRVFEFCVWLADGVRECDHHLVRTDSHAIETGRSVRSDVGVDSMAVYIAWIATHVWQLCDWHYSLCVSIQWFK